MTDSGIYMITNTVNGRIYVGSSKTIRRRKYQHLLYLRRGKHHNRYLQRDFNKCGEAAFAFETLLYTTDLANMERFFLLSVYDNQQQCYNLSKEPYTTSDVVFTDARRDAIRALHQGNTHRLGKRHTEESKQRCRESKLGKRLTEEHKLKISAGMKRNRSQGCPSN